MSLSDDKIFNKHIVETIPITEVLTWLSMLKDKNKK